MANVRDFGATGDGATDDSEAIQHAVDQGDGLVELPKGSYRITRPIVLDMRRVGYLAVRGADGTARILHAGPGPALRLLGNHQGTAQPESVKPRTWQQERMPIVTGLEILGLHPESDGIELLHTMQATIERVLIRRCRIGIRLAERNRNFLLTGSHIYDCHDTGLLMDRCNLHQVIIAANHISYCKRAGIRQLHGDVHNIQITGNDIEYNSGMPDVTSGEIVLEAPETVVSEYTIASNTLQATADAAGANVLILGNQDDRAGTARLINITGNVLGSRQRNLVIHHGIRTSITGNTIYGGAELNVAFSDCQYVALASNTILTRPSNWKIVTTDGVLLDRCTGCTVQGNIMNDCRYGDAAGGGTITVRDSHEIAVSGCQIFDPAWRGIHLHNSHRCRISDNTIVDRREKPTMLSAIEVSGESRNILVQNNAVGRAAKEPIVCDESLGKVAGNTFWES